MPKNQRRQNKAEKEFALSQANSKQPWKTVFLVEDNAQRAEREKIVGLHKNGRPAAVVVSLHKIMGHKVNRIADLEYTPGALGYEQKYSGRSAIALRLIDSCRPSKSSSLILAGTSYGSTAKFVRDVVERDLRFVMEVMPSTRVHVIRKNMKRGSISSVPASTLLSRAKWRTYKIRCPIAKAPMLYSIARLAKVRLGDAVVTLFAAQVGAIDGLHRGTIIGISSVRGGGLKQLLQVAGWIRWIRPIMREKERKTAGNSKLQSSPRRRTTVNGVKFRSNIMLSRQFDESFKWCRRQLAKANQSGPQLQPARGALNVAELFAGAGGMGLGFLLASSRDRRFRIVASGEVNPIFVKTLHSNHREFASRSGGWNAVPHEVEPIDLAAGRSMEVIQSQIKNAGGVHVLIGGPPCQGFSNANRNSWEANNPHNKFISVFLRYVERLAPPVFLMENVQGILWTPKKTNGTSHLNVVDALSNRLRKAGYELFPKLLDAVWYGVPQNRSRFFLLGIHKDLGYRASDFDSWGPFPRPTHGPAGARPYVTVKHALGDLPRIGNGHSGAEMKYACPSRALKGNAFLSEMRRYAPSGVIYDHVTSKHADYVIARYRKIPQGGNWEDIVEDLTNYAEVSRTHSNIYRRLKWNDPAITIGNFRKSMLVHPNQDRGLSLREASRLQSFPDWFRFAGSANGNEGGLVHKQQQLANAVCPLVSKAIAQLILGL